MSNVRHPKAVATCQQVLDALPDVPIFMVLHGDDWAATGCLNFDAPFVTLDPQARGVEVAVRPRGGTSAPNVGHTLLVHYPLYDPEYIHDEFVAELRRTVLEQADTLADAAEIASVDR